MDISVTPAVAKLGEKLTVNLPGNYWCRVLCYLGPDALEDGDYQHKAEIPLYPYLWLQFLPDCTDTRSLPPERVPWVEVEVYDDDGVVLARLEERFDIVVGQEFAPELDWDLSPVNTLSQILQPGYQDRYFQGVSRVQAVTDVNCWPGARVVKTNLEVEGKTYEGLNGPLQSHVLTSMGETLVKISATDSRGLTTTYQEIIHLTPYTRPVAALAEQGAYRSDDAGNPDPEGSYLSVYALATTYPLTGGNEGYLRYRLTPVGGSPGSFSTVSLEQGVVPGVVLLPEYSYTLEILPCDQVCQGNILQVTIPKRGVYAHQTDDGLALGMYRQQGGLEVAWPARFYDSVSIGSATLTEDTLKKLLKLL